MRDPDAFLVARLRFRHLELVRLLGSLRSIRKTASAMRVSEPAVSKALGEIETSFGFLLFERSAAGVTPTERGEAVIEGARLLLASLRHVRQTAVDAERGQVIRLGVAPFLAMTLVPRLLQTLEDGSARCQVLLREGPGSALLRHLLDGELDAILVAMSQEVIDMPGASNLSYRVLYDETLSIIAPRGHPLARRRTVQWRSLADERWILPPPPSMVEASIRAAFAGQGVVPPIPVILSQAPATNVALVASGLGIAAVPKPMTSMTMLRGAIEELRVSPRAPLPSVSLVHQRAAGQTASIRLLADALDRVFADPDGAAGARSKGR